MRKKYGEMILKYSLNKICLKNALLEWQLIDNTNIDDTAMYKILNLHKPKEFDYKDHKCICGHKIYQIFLIKNKHNNIVLATGCDCIEKTENIELIEHTKYLIKKNQSIEKIISNISSTNFNNNLNTLLDLHYKQVEHMFNTETNKVKGYINKLLNMTVTFGKYKGKKYIEMPKYYILWYIEKKKSNGSFNSPVLNKIAEFYFPNLCHNNNVIDQFIEDI